MIICHAMDSSPHSNMQVCTARAMGDIMNEAQTRSMDVRHALVLHAPRRGAVDSPSLAVGRINARLHIQNVDLQPRWP